MNNIALLIGRIFIVTPFLVTIFGNITYFSGIKTLYLTIRGIPFPEFTLIAGTIILILGSISLLSGFKLKIGCLLLILFLIPVTYLYEYDFSNPVQALNFFKNLALFGGIMLIFFSDPGKYSIDYWLKSRKSMQAQS